MQRAFPYPDKPARGNRILKRDLARALVDAVLANEGGGSKRPNPEQVGSRFEATRAREPANAG